MLLGTPENRRVAMRLIVKDYYECTQCEFEFWHCEEVPLTDPMVELLTNHRGHVFPVDRLLRLMEESNERLSRIQELYTRASIAQPYYK